MPRNILKTQKYHFSFIATQKYQLILHLYKSVHKHKISQKMQIEAKIASSKPRNIS